METTTGSTTTLHAAEPVSSSGQSLGDEQLRLLLQALGGSSNIDDVEARGTRLKVRVKDHALLDDALIIEAGLRGATVVADGLVHVLADDGPDPIKRELRTLIDAT